MNYKSDFGMYLRTGRVRRPVQAPTEFKFNPWHDQDDGRFTFAGQGGYFAGGRGPSDSRTRTNRDGRSGEQSQSYRYHKYEPRDPRNHSTYVVRRGDSLTSIAAKRRGLKVADLAWLKAARTF